MRGRAYGRRSQRGHRFPQTRPSAVRAASVLGWVVGGVRAGWDPEAVALGPGAAVLRTGDRLLGQAAKLVLAAAAQVVAVRFGARLAALLDLLADLLDLQGEVRQRAERDRQPEVDQPVQHDPEGRGPDRSAEA